MGRAPVWASASSSFSTPKPGPEHNGLRTYAFILHLADISGFLLPVGGEGNVYFHLEEEDKS